MRLSRLFAIGIFAAAPLSAASACGGSSANVDPGDGGASGAGASGDASTSGDGSRAHSDGGTSSDGGSSTCASGPENTVAACSDGCDNDGDGFIDANDYDCCGIVPNAVCRKKSTNDVACPGVSGTWSAASLLGTQTYHETATAVGTFAETAWIWQCSPTDLTASQATTPPPGERQITFHVTIPADAPARTVVSFTPSVSSNVRYWTMLGSCGAGASCSVPPSGFNGAGTTMGSLTPGSEIYYEIESDDSSSDTVTLGLDLTNQ